MLEMTPVESSLIAAIGYDTDKEELCVEFKKGGVYVYSGVPQAVAESFKASPSVGRYFLNNIKDRYDTVKKCTP